MAFCLNAVGPARALPVIGGLGGDAKAKADSAANQIRDKWALVVGVGHFQDSSIGSMEVGVKNALEFARVLKNPDIGKFPTDHVASLLGARATKSSIENIIAKNWLAKKALPSDLVLLYFSTKLIIDTDGKGVSLCAFDTLSSEPALSGIDLEELLTDVRRRIQTPNVAPNIVCVLDTAPANSSEMQATQSLVEEISKKSGVTIFAASRSLGSSLGTTATHNSLFTYYISEALSNSAGQMPLSAVAKYVAAKIEEQTKPVGDYKQVAVLACPDANKQMTACVLGVPTILKKSFSMGHPMNHLMVDRPDLVVSRRLLAQAPTKKTPSKTEVDDDDDDAGSGHADFSGYITKMKQDIQSKWQPPKGFEDEQVTTVFTIKRDGTIVDPQITQGSGKDAVDKSALEALQKASPLAPLPAGAPKSVQMRYQFQWHVKRQ
jgi:TonB family protein